VKNNGPSGATDVSVVFRSTPMLYSCPPCIADVPALASGTSTQVGPYPIASGPSYASATASSHQPDVEPANNQISWCSASGISMESAYLTPGKQGTITAGVTFTHTAPAAASSDPSVVTVSAPILSSDGTRVTLTASALKPGSATITVGSATLRVLVSAAGTLPRWPGGVSVRLDLSSVSFDQPAQLFVRPDGTAPFSGAMATGTVTLSGQGQQITKGLTSQLTYSFYPPSLGTFSYQVDYSGDATFEPQTQKVTVFVSKGRATLRALLEPIAGQPGSFSLKVGAAGSPVTPPSGALSIRNGSTEIATLTLSMTSNGDAAAQTVLTNLPDSPTLTIVYAGDPLYDSTSTSVRALQPHRRAVRH
jgi:hypothetical protein